MIGNKLNGKNILFQLIQTFHLEKEIKQKLELFGANVYYYDERPANNNFTKGILRINKKLISQKVKKYYLKILKEVSEIKLDYYFLIRGEVVPEFFLKELKKQQPQCHFIFYNWDSFKNTPNISFHLSYFDKKFTFDNQDAKNYRLSFRPLFFTDYFNKLHKNHSVLTQEKIEKYDLLFLGTAHSDRYIISNNIKEWCNQNNLKAFCYYYLQGRMVYFYKKLFDKSFKHFEYKKLSFKPLSLKEMAEYYYNSRVILDINHPNQKGLTMRTFESIGAEKKLITTNKEITKYSFYHPNNFFVIDRDNYILDLDFFSTPYKKMESDKYQNYTMEGWLEDLFFAQE